MGLLVTKTFKTKPTTQSTQMSALTINTASLKFARSLFLSENETSQNNETKGIIIAK